MQMGEEMGSGERGREGVGGRICVGGWVFIGLERDCIWESEVKRGCESV